MTGLSSLRDRAAARLAALRFNPSRWRPIGTAPKDGTRVLIATPRYTCEGFDVMEARFCTTYGRHEEPAELHPYWWALSWRTGMQGWERMPDQGEPRELSPYGAADLSAVTPKYWMPMPDEPPE